VKALLRLIELIRDDFPRDTEPSVDDLILATENRKAASTLQEKMDATIAEARVMLPAKKKGPALSFSIICPDCGKGESHHGRCPKCYGKSWMPAGRTDATRELKQLRALVHGGDAA
jgi:hypothetical protein